MPKKTIIIFMSVFILVGVIILGFYFWFNKTPSTNTADGTTPWYQNFNPFGTGTKTPTDTTIDENLPDTQIPGQVNTGVITSRFYQITDFAVAGATFLQDTRPITFNPNFEIAPEPEIIKTTISPVTKEGRMDIQKILNETLSLKPALVVDGSFGKKVTEAIKAFQKLNNLSITGEINIETAPFFTKTSIKTDTKVVSTVEEAPSIRYVERMNGHIYKMFLDTKNKEKISNSTIPNIYEAFFDNTAKTVIYRYVSEDNVLSTFIATLGAPKGDFLPQNIVDFSAYTNKNKFFYLTKNSNGSTGSIITLGDIKKEIVFNSPFTEWLSQWDNNERIFLTTKPSYNINGNIFILNSLTKTISKVLGGIKGLTTLVSPNGSFVLYSTSTGNGPKLSIYDIRKHTSIELNKYGLPEKCVWSIDNINVYCSIPNVINGNQYPDSWYQGLVSFNDYFVKINTKNGEWETFANSQNETPVDGTYLFLDKTESNLFFTNKKNSTLWSLSLK